MTALLRKYQPDIVLTHLLADRNPEHGQTADLVYRAFLRAVAQGARVGQLWMPVGRRLQYLERVRLQPDVSVDVTDSVERNGKALALHVSQNGGNPAFRRPRFEHFIIVVNNKKG